MMPKTGSTVCFLSPYSALPALYVRIVVVPIVLKELKELCPQGFGYEDQRGTTQRSADAITLLAGVQYSQPWMRKPPRRWDWSWQQSKCKDVRITGEMRIKSLIGRLRSGQL
ncbi:MAG: hypothetical protein ACJAWL_001738 [Motiliproteus sp.]|jgi:hypothetical protein